MKRITQFLLLITFSLGLSTAAQQDSPGGRLEYVGQSATMRVIPSIQSRMGQIEPAPANNVEPMDGRHSVRGVKSNVVPGKDPQTIDDPLAANPGKFDKAFHLGRALKNDFVVNNFPFSPSDPSLAVGPDHTFIVFNTGFIIYDKEGNDLTGPMSTNAIFSPGGCCDLTVTYDNNANRWVVTYLFLPGVELAVSSGPNPLTSTWTVYLFPQVEDYNKLSRWRDGYYITENGTFDVWVIDREAVLNGNPDANIQGFVIDGVEGQFFTSAQVANITDNQMPETGGAPLVYIRDDGFFSADTDAINIWTLDVDFDTPGNSTVSAPEVFSAPEDITPFINVFDGGNFSNLEQPGVGMDIDALQSTIMNQMQFRKFSAHNSLIFNFVIDTDAGNGELAGIRWYEFRQSEDGGPWSLEQEGTYTAPDGRHAWVGSMAMDNQGNIGMGYSSMAGPTTPNPSDFPVGAYITGQLGDAEPGVMNVAEQFIGENGDIFGTTRFGDYAKVDIDPINDKEFWFITEYNRTNHVSIFQIQPDLSSDLSVVLVDTPEDGDLSAPQEVTVTIMNFGLTEASDFDIAYSIDGATIATEPFTGSISPGETASFTFTALGDFLVEGQAYELTVSTLLSDDEFNGNDAFTKTVRHLYSDDTGVVNLTAPISSVSQVTIEIENFGSTTQTSIPVFYTLNGDVVQENYTGSLAQGETDTYTFLNTVDTSDLGEYVFTAGTELAADEDETNDDITRIIVSTLCMPESNCTGNGGIRELNLVDQSINTECSDNGYADNTDIVFNFVLADNPFQGVLQTAFINSPYAIWIDFNDNKTFEEDEIVASGMSSSVVDAETEFVVDFTDISDEIISGDYIMRVRGKAGNFGLGDVTNPCEDLNFGRTNDYTANISGVLGSSDEIFASTALQVHSLGNKQFEVRFNDTSSFSNKLPITIYNGSGQIMAYYTTDNKNGYSKVIDMSFVSSGVYFVRVGTDQLNKVKKIIVE